jgi:L-threonine-O-3-phosphate decarboxylase
MDVVHGALDFEELEQQHLQPSGVLDFSTNTNPYGPSPVVSAALSQTPVDRYPDREALALRRKLADCLGISPQNILVGNGSAELLWLAALAYLDANQAVLVIGPTFGEYARASALMGAAVDEWLASSNTGFTPDPHAIAHQLSQRAYRLVFLCNPNNPTGQALAQDDLASWAQAFPNTLFVVDEAYIAFADGSSSAISLPQPNLLVLRSMTKDYALSGLRLGYAVGHTTVIEALRKVRPPWNVNAMAQSAGIAALSDSAHLSHTLAKLAMARQELIAALRRRSLKVVPTRVHFFLMEVGNAARLRASLLAKGILVRDCASFGLPAYVRIAARRPEENSRLLAALDEVLQ